MYIIGIDIGTGSTKAVALDEHGNTLISAQIPYPTLSPGPGLSEQDPEVIWAAFTKCVARITTSLSIPPEAIALSSAMHSLICVSETGQPLANMITWADNRSAEVAGKLKNSPLGKKLYAETGTPVHAMAPLCKLLWMKENDAELFGKTAKFISIKEYCWFRMFSKFETDYSIASATGLFDINRCKWHADALELVGINDSRLSTPENTSFFRSGIKETVAVEMNLPSSTKVVIGGSDGCLANVGSFATEPGIAALTIGTSGAIRVAGHTAAVDVEFMPFNYRLDEKTFISGGPINNGGAALKWYAESILQRTLSSEADYEAILKPAESVPPGSDGLVFLPYIQGERAPIWNSDTCGVFFGITSRHKQIHFTRAVLEGITFSLFQIARSLKKSGLDIFEIRVSGGFVKSKFWVQLLADIFGKRVRLASGDDASAIGAAMIAMKALGMTTPAENGSHSIVFDPDPEAHEVYMQRTFPMYENLYKALVGEMKTFHENRTESTDTLQHSSLK